MIYNKLYIKQKKLKMVRETKKGGGRIPNYYRSNKQIDFCLFKESKQIKLPQNINQFIFLFNKNI